MNSYYSMKCSEYKNNTKKLWQLINTRIGKCKHRGSIILYISINGIRTYNPDKIANNFSQFCVDLGETLASKITPGNKRIDDYIGSIPRTISSIVIRPTMQNEVEKLISALPNKTSSGHNQVSITLQSITGMQCVPRSHEDGRSNSTL